MPTIKELEQLQKAKSTLKEILKVHMREPINDNEFQTLFGNMKRLRKNGCELIWSADISKSCLLYTSPSPRDRIASRMPSSA